MNDISMGKRVTFMKWNLFGPYSACFDIFNTYWNFSLMILETYDKDVLICHPTVCFACSKLLFTAELWELYARRTATYTQAWLTRDGSQQGVWLCQLQNVQPQVFPLFCQMKMNMSIMTSLVVLLCFLIREDTFTYNITKLYLYLFI